MGNLGRSVVVGLMCGACGCAESASESSGSTTPAPLVRPQVRYTRYEDIMIDGASAVGRMARLSLRSISVRTDEIQVGMCDGEPKMAWIDLRFTFAQREAVRRFVGEECRPVQFTVGEQSMFHVLSGDLVAIEEPPAPAAASWPETKVEKDGYSFTMPWPPKPEGDELVAESEERQYRIGTVSLPPGVSGEEALARYVPAVVEANGTLRGSNALSHRGRPAQDLVISKGDGFFLIRLIFVEPRHHLIAASVATDRPSADGDAQRFFASIRAL
jgi:hypothetical protein